MGLAGPWIVFADEFGKPGFSVVQFPGIALGVFHVRLLNQSD
jgi:hypothetical protein